MNNDAPWLDAPAVPTGADDDAPWLRAPAVKPPAPPSTWQQVKESAARVPVLGPAAETAWGVGSGVAAAPIAGLAGIAGAMLPGRPGQGADWVKATQDALTYEPESRGAQATLHVLGYPGAKIAEAGDWAGERVSDVAGPAAGAAVNTAVNALPLAVGTRLPGTRNSALAAAMQTMDRLPGAPTGLDALAIKKAANLQRDTAATNARKAGFVLPPSQVESGGIRGAANSVLEGLAGKVQTAQELSAKNQLLQQAKLRNDLGIAPDMPLAPETMDLVRSDAGKAYDRLREAGVLPAPPTVRETVSKLVDASGEPIKTTTATATAPGLPITDEFRSQIAGKADALRAKIAEAPEAFGSLGPSLRLLDEMTMETLPDGTTVPRVRLDSNLAVDRIKQLRADAKADFASRDPAQMQTARTRLGLANSLEDLFEQNLQKIGDTTALQDFRNARKTIAKSYTAENALAPSGEVRAFMLANELKKGTPLEGGMREIAGLGAEFPKAAQLPSRIGGTPAVSPLSVATAALGHNWVPAAASAVRAPLRAALTSDWYQRMMVKPPSYGPSFGSRLVQGLQQPGVLPAMEALGQSDEARRAALLRALTAQP